MANTTRNIKIAQDDAIRVISNATEAAAKTLSSATDDAAKTLASAADSAVKLLASKADETAKALIVETNKPTEDGVIRTIFKNEITWIILIVGSVWSFTSMVILPINTIQTQLAEIKNQLVAFQGIQNDVNTLKSEQATQDAQIQAIMKNLKL